MKLKILLLLTIPLALITYHSVLAQAPECLPSGSPAKSRADFLITSPNLAGKFGSKEKVCIINEDRAAFVPYFLTEKITYSSLKSIYYTQAKDLPSQHIKKHSPAANPTDLPGNKIQLTGNDSHLYNLTGDLSISDPNTINGNSLGIIFIDKNLTITQNQIGAGNTGLVFVVAGDVIIDPSVSEINAVIISSGKIFTAGNNCTASSVQTSPLSINGSLISLSSDNPIKFCRKLADNQNAAEVINQQPKYLIILRDTFADTLQKWSELP